MDILRNCKQELPVIKDRRNIQTFLVLVPHRDIRVEIRKYSDSLVKTGLTGVYSFPWVAPLAVISNPLESDKLKEIAKSMRKTVGNDKIYIKEQVITSFPGKNDLFLYGYRLDLPVFNEINGSFIKNMLTPVTLGVFLTPKMDLFVNTLPPLSFRSAAIANMFWQPYKNGFHWEIGKLYWLPKKNQ